MTDRDDAFASETHALAEEMHALQGEVVAKIMDICKRHGDQSMAIAISGIGAMGHALLGDAERLAARRDDL